MVRGCRSVGRRPRQYTMHAWHHLLVDHTAPAPAMAFVKAIVDEDATTVWSLMSDTFRLSYAQVWAFHAGTSEQTARRISQHGPGDPLWPRFAEVMIEGLLLTLGDFVEVISSGRLGLYSEVIPVGPDLEQVVFMDDLGTAGPTPVAALQPVEALRVFVLTTSRDQRVAGLKGAVPQPGWPPNMNARVDDAGWRRPPQ